jgi:hypothetical protein
VWLSDQRPLLAVLNKCQIAISLIERFRSIESRFLGLWEDYRQTGHYPKTSNGRMGDNPLNAAAERQSDFKKAGAFRRVRTSNHSIAPICVRVGNLLLLGRLR